MGVIVVTGAASGIGAACVERFRSDGHDVLGVDVQQTDIVGDLGTPEGRATVVEAVADRSPDGIQGLVTCAGLAGWPGQPGSLLAAVNYFGTVEILAGLRPLLARGAPSAAVAISSNSATVQPDVPMDVVAACLDGDERAARALADDVGPMATYPATKVALARWVRRQAPTNAWIGADVRLNAIAPGMIDTPMVAEGMTDPGVRSLLDEFPIPRGRPGRPEEIAALVRFLIGPEATFLCGSLVFADGGSDALLRPDAMPLPWQLDAPDPTSSA